MLPLRREHILPKVNVSAVYLDFDLEITLENDPQETQMALKTRPKPPQNAPRRSQRRYFGVSGGLLGGS